ncbi:hypothetical protein BpHYR1_045119 [Brachionus plicatilis]|uniref:Uncharacterized protein n=1 Tax=Brachionus plicatilis TaxID=10195 RepID=A0A3M7PIR7_BRAPC|nr:hypothetical protein BpHYR1_045119 [Brachionus plicatilis]
MCNKSCYTNITKSGLVSRHEKENKIHLISFCHNCSKTQVDFFELILDYYQDLQLSLWYIASLAIQLEINLPSTPRKKKRPRRFCDSDDEIDEQIYINLIDIIHKNIENRFDFQNINPISTIFSIIISEEKLDLEKLFAELELWHHLKISEQLKKLKELFLKNQQVSPSSEKTWLRHCSQAH